MMWPTILVLLTLAVQALATEDTGECVMSEWSAWGPCITGEQEAPKDGGSEGTYEEEPSEGGDIGREVMQVLHAAKLNHWSMVAECQEAGTCPEFNPRPSQTEEPVACMDGMSGDYPCHLVDMMAFLSLSDLGYTDEVAEEVGDWHPAGSDIWGWTDPMTLREYALMGVTGGTSFVDVTDPLRPNVLAFLKTRTYPSSWRDLKVYNNTVYIGSEASQHGLQVFDLLRLRDMTEFSYVEADYVYKGFGQSHNIVSDEVTGYVYAVGSYERYDEYGDRTYEPCKAGFHIMDVRADRLRPEFVGCYEDDGYVHDAQCVIYHGPHRRYQGRHICFNFNEDTLTIVDMTHPRSPRLVSKTGYTGAAYTHQGWLTEDHVTLLLDDEYDEVNTGTQTHTYIWDVTKLHKPRLRSLFKSTQYAIDHNMYIHNGLVFQSNYGAGLRILHFDEEEMELHEVGYFDVLPTSAPTPAFEGTWSNYPYYPSGTVVVSSIEYGLYVLQPNYEHIWSDIEAHHSYYEETRTRTILSAPPGAVCPSEVQPRQCRPEK